MVGDNADRRCGDRHMGFAVRPAVPAVFQEVLRRAAERVGVDCPVAVVFNFNHNWFDCYAWKSIFCPRKTREERQRWE